MNITETQKQQYQDEGYFNLEQARPREDLRGLIETYQQSIDGIHQEMDTRGTDKIGVNERGRQYMVTNCYSNYPSLGQFLFSPLMADVCRATIGEEAYLLWDQFVVKGPGMRMPFEWHPDGGCIGHDHRPYVICWCAMDHMDLDNGTIHVLPFSKAGVRDRVPHRRDPETKQPVGYFGSEPGVPVIGPPGTIGVCSSLSFHKSGINISDRFRRA